MTPESRNPATLAAGRAGNVINGLVALDASSNNANPSYSQALIARRYRLEPVIARLVCHLAGIGLTANTYTLIDPLYAHVGSACANLAIVFWTNATIAQDAYFRIAADLYPGFERPFFKRRDTTAELERCLPWYRKMAAKRKVLSAS
jgi:hypothetical protein